MGLLRILLAFCVFCAHTRNVTHLAMLPGDSAVEAFFLISGFYMQIVLEKRYSRTTLGKFWVLKFYASRYMRLYPGYIVMAIAAMLICLAGYVPQPSGVWHDVSSLKTSLDNIALWLFLIATNLTIFLQDATMFLGVNAGHAHFTAAFQTSEITLWPGLAVPQGWSLGIELSFYLIAPFLLNLRTGWLFGIAVISFATKVFSIRHWGLSDPFTYRFFPFEICYFITGSLAFRLRRILDFSVLPHSVRLVACGSAIAFVTCDPISFAASPSARLIILALSLPLVFSVTLKSVIDRAIGELSYPFYISHWFALSITDGAINTWSALLLTVALSIFLLVAEQKYLEPWRERIAGTTRESSARSGNLRLAFREWLRFV